MTPGLADQAAFLGVTQCEKTVPLPATGATTAILNLPAVAPDNFVHNQKAKAVSVGLVWLNDSNNVSQQFGITPLSAMVMMAAECCVAIRTCKLQSGECLDGVRQEIGDNLKKSHLFSQGPRDFGRTSLNVDPLFGNLLMVKAKCRCCQFDEIDLLHVCIQANKGKTSQKLRDLSEAAKLSIRFIQIYDALLRIPPEL